MDKVSRILDVIDTGLQTPVPDPTFGEISPADEGGCLRCSDTWLDEVEDLCSGCRAFLLGDSDEDPAEASRLAEFDGIDVEAAAAGFAALGHGFRRLSQQFIEGMNAVTRVLSELPDEVKQELVAQCSDTIPRERRGRGTT